MELRAWLAERDTTPSAFARELNLSHSTITRMLNGKAKPSAQVVEQVFAKTGGKVTANDLFNQVQASAG